MLVLSRLWRARGSVLRRARAVLPLLLVLPFARAVAHEVPRHVGVRAFVAPHPDRVRLLVQIPMDAVRDIDWPRRASGSLDVARAAPYLRDAALLWIRDGVTLSDGSRALPAPALIAVRAALPSDRAFDGYATAMGAVRDRPIEAAVEIPLEK